MRLMLSVGILVISAAVSTRLVLAEQEPPPPAAAAPAQEPAPSPTFRSGVEVMNLSVTVTDKRGRPVTDLTQDDFTVLEDKKPQALVRFSSSRDGTTAPIGLGLVLDASASMSASKLQSMRIAVESMVNKRIGKEDEMYVVEFATDVRLTKPWTTDRRAVVDTIRRIKTREGTAIYNAIAGGLQVSRTGKHKKQVILLITDGQDSHSTIKNQDVAMLARASDVVIYALVVDEDEGMYTRSNDNLRQAAGELSAVTDAPGGRTQYVQGFAGLEKAIDEMGKEFTQQYELAYSRETADGKFHEIAVAVKRPDVSVRHRRVYFAPTAAQQAAQTPAAAQ